MEITPVYTCPCSNRTYPHRRSLLAHHRTKMHTKWVSENELRDLKISLTKRDNKILTLKNDNRQLMKVNELLLDRIKTSN